MFTYPIFAASGGYQDDEAIFLYDNTLNLVHYWSSTNVGTSHTRHATYSDSTLLGPGAATNDYVYIRRNGVNVYQYKYDGTTALAQVGVGVNHGGTQGNLGMHYHAGEGALVMVGTEGADGARAATLVESPYGLTPGAGVTTAGIDDWTVVFDMRLTSELGTVGYGNIAVFGGPNDVYDIGVYTLSGNTLTERLTFDIPASVDMSLQKGGVNRDTGMLGGPESSTSATVDIYRIDQSDWSISHFGEKATAYACWACGFLSAEDGTEMMVSIQDDGTANNRLYLHEVHPTTGALTQLDVDTTTLGDPGIFLLEVAVSPYTNRVYILSENLYVFDCSQKTLNHLDTLTEPSRTTESDNYRKIWFGPNALPTL